MNINIDRYKAVGFSLQELENLQRFLGENPLHWIQLNNEGIFELVLDNQMMADYRQCPEYFKEAHILGHYPKGTGAKPWPLLFGELFHYMIERYYIQFRDIKFDLQDWAIRLGTEKWQELDLDRYNDHREYKTIGGCLGFIGLITSYYLRYSPENEHFRIIGTEISFGHEKEVSLGVLSKEEEWLWCFLAGRIDLLIDNGTDICPLDHKTMSSFRFDPAGKYEQEEGPTGYIYAVNKILPSLLPQGAQLKRNTNKIIMNYISKSIPPDGRERFKRIPILKTSEQLEAYRKRMLITQEKIFRDLVRVASGEALDRDTSKCSNWYMHDCSYLPIHRQNSKENELVILNNYYEKKSIWNTEKANETAEQTEP